MKRATELGRVRHNVLKILTLDGKTINQVDCVVVSLTIVLPCHGV